MSDQHPTPHGLRIAALAAAVLALAAPALTGSAYAANDMEVGLEDNRLALHEPAGKPGQLESTIGQWAAAGVDVVRLHARWASIAPAGTRVPAGFRAEDPNDPLYYWAPLDNAVRVLRAHGIRVMLTVTGSGPVWSSRNPSRRDPRWKPDPRKFAKFASAVAKRYAAEVDRYLLWNEPNQQIWLRPQGECSRRGGCRPVSPALYRGLVRAAYPAIKAADPTAQVLMGELAPIGRGVGSYKRSLKPLVFLRSMACVDRRLKRIRGGRCRGFRAPVADAFGYHPHPVRNSPTRRNRDRDEAQLADLPRLQRLLDRLTARRRLRVGGGGRRFDLYLTEFGYQTNPPDDLVGVSPTTQARWLQHSAYIAWRNPRVRNLTQYEWQDEPVREDAGDLLALGGWQSGLFFEDGTAKPSAASFPNPFWVDLRAGAGTARFWGQVRRGGAHRVTIERRLAEDGPWETVAALDTDSNGYFVAMLAVPERAAYRYTYALPPAEPGGAPTVVASATQDAAPR